MGLQHHPVVMVLRRQECPTPDRTTPPPPTGLRKGGYIPSEAPGGKPQAIIMGTGSEIDLCLQAQDALAKEGINVRVVSMPSWELFENQDEAYHESVLPSNVTARVSVEQAGRFGWERYVGTTGRRVGMKTFGASAPLKELQKKFGFTVADVVKDVK